VPRSLLMIDDPQDGQPSVGLTNEALPTVTRRRRSPVLLGIRDSTDHPCARRRLDRRPGPGDRGHCKKSRAKHAGNLASQLLTQCPRSIQIGACLLLMRDVSGQTPEERALRRWLARNIHRRTKFIHLSRHFGIEPRSRPDRGRVRHGGLWPCAIWKPQARMAIQQLRLR